MFDFLDDILFSLLPDRIQWALIGLGVLLLIGVFAYAGYVNLLTWQ